MTRSRPRLSSRPACWSWTVTREAIDAAYRARTTEQAHDVLMTWQLGQCALCGTADRDLCLDHDHGTLLVRGLLCGGCNVAEGKRHDAGIVAYRRIHPAYLLDMAVRYAVRGDAAYRSRQNASVRP